MTLREIFPEWWCKITFSVPEYCYGNYNWLDLSIYEFIFSFVVILFIKWIINCLLLILGQLMARPLTFLSIYKDKKTFSNNLIKLKIVLE